MALAPVPLDCPDLELPPAVVALLRDAELGERELLRQDARQPAGGFRPSDYPRVYATLHALRHSGLLRGELLCEWGSGSGVGALLAESLGFEAYGIEIQEPLVALARELADSRGADARFALGSFVPDPALLDEAPEDVGFVSHDGEDGHGELELEPADLDVVLCYPWPGEEPWVELLFERLARPGALLVSYRDREGLSIHRA